MYYDLDEIASQIASELNASQAFNHVDVVQLSNAGQLFETLDAVAALPSAVVTITSVTYGKLQRNIEVMIVVTDDFKAQPADRAAGIWQLSTIAANLFLPQIAKGNSPEPRLYCGIEFAVNAIRPVAGYERVAAYMITATGTEVCKYDN